LSSGIEFREYALQVQNSRTYPPLTTDQSPEAMLDRSGLERLQANAAGRVPPPPAGYLLGFRIREAELGRVVFDFSPLPAHSSYGGTVHGGILSAVVDSAMGCAVLSMLDAGEWCASLELKVNFLAPVRCEGGDVVAVGLVTKIGGRVAFAEATLVVGADICVTATSTYAVRRSGSRHLPGRPK
jgi:uncharacterized protein (TIGR00369 family)